MHNLPTIRRELRERFGKGKYRISTGGAVRVYGPLPVAPHLTDWHLHGFVTERGLEPVRRPAVHVEH